MNASASIFTVGLASMNWPSGRAASNITATATRIAVTITGTYSPAMPTAAITESSENTISITAIWAITPPNDTAAFAAGLPSWSPPPTSSRISSAPFTSRNTPPKISTRSRTEMPCPSSTNRSVVRLASQARVSSSRMRVMQATAMPNLRANSRRSGGSLLTAIEMNTRLSMPSTISIVLRVNSRIQTCGSLNIAVIYSSFGSLQPARDQHQAPHQQDVQHGHEHRRRAHVLGAAGQLVLLRPEPLDHRFDGRIEQLHRQHHQAAAQRQRALDAIVAKPQCNRREQHEQARLEPERRLVQPGRAQALQRPHRRLQDPRRTARQVPGFVRHQPARMHRPEPALPAGPGGGCLRVDDMPRLWTRHRPQPRNFAIFR